MVAATLRHLTSLRLMVGNTNQDWHEKNVQLICFLATGWWMVCHLTSVLKSFINQCLQDPHLFGRS